MLSIIIPTLNEQEHLPRLLESIKNQSFTDYEIIVADAGSQDRTIGIARGHNCQVVAGGLPAKGRNSGAGAARGSILLFLDADVVLPPGFLQHAVSQFGKRSLGIAGFLMVPMKATWLDILIYMTFDIFVRICGGLFPHAGLAIMVKKSVHEAVSGFNEKITLMEDLSYAKATARISRYAYLRQPFYVSMRRYQKDGRFTYIKYFLAGLKVLCFGPITSQMFHYTFNHYKKDE